MMAVAPGPAARALIEERLAAWTAARDQWRAFLAGRSPEDYLGEAALEAWRMAESATANLEAALGTIHDQEAPSCHA